MLILYVFWQSPSSFLVSSICNSNFRLLFFICLVATVGKEEGACSVLSTKRQQNASEEEKLASRLMNHNLDFSLLKVKFILS